jgi:hypothetical protein
MLANLFSFPVSCTAWFGIRRPSDLFFITTSYIHGVYICSMMHTQLTLSLLERE